MPLNKLPTIYPDSLKKLFIPKAFSPIFKKILLSEIMKNAHDAPIDINKNPYIIVEVNVEVSNIIVKIVSGYKTNTFNIEYPNKIRFGFILLLATFKKIVDITVPNNENMNIFESGIPLIEKRLYN